MEHHIEQAGRGKEIPKSQMERLLPSEAGRNAQNPLRLSGCSTPFSLQLTKAQQPFLSALL
jgi:hypothetical protein